MNRAPSSMPSQNSYESDPHSPNQRLDQNSEAIRERYPNGTVRIERQVIQDENRNFINHGDWKYFLPSGRLAGQAQFDMGKKSGTWSRWVIPQECPALASNAFRSFKAPFLSTFEYQDGELNGPWRISDSAKRTMVEINFKEGKRHGPATWFFVNGRKSIEINYNEGKIHGDYQKWNLENRLIENRRFESGHEIGSITEFHRRGVKKLEYGILAGEIQVVTPDDPWSVKFAEERKVGTDIKDGVVRAWYPNGQLRLEGKFEKNVQSGNFVWYFANGQKQAQGKIAGDERQGEWNWWHENGMRSSSGYYVDGEPTGNWQWWELDGKLARVKDFGEVQSDGATTDSSATQNASFRDGK